MSMTIAGISTNVQALLVASNYFVTVLPGPPDDKQKFSGYPAAAHYYDDSENQYATVSQNRRIHQYVVELYIIPDASTATTDLLTNEAYPLVDNVISLFDASIDLSSSTLGLARACDIMRPAPGRLERIETKEGVGLMMTIRLFCEADIAFR